MSKEWFAAAERMLATEAKGVDIIIGTALIPGRPAPRLITEVSRGTERRWESGHGKLFKKKVGNVCFDLLLYIYSHFTLELKTLIFVVIFGFYSFFIGLITKFVLYTSYTVKSTYFGFLTSVER